MNPEYVPEWGMNPGFIPDSKTNSGFVLDLISSNEKELNTETPYLPQLPGHWRSLANRGADASGPRIDTAAFGFPRASQLPREEACRYGQPTTNSCYLSTARACGNVREELPVVERSPPFRDLGGLGTDGRRAEAFAAAMKCKKHPYELGEGVCASCLRERLLALAREQSGGARRRAGFSSCSPQPALVDFPRSVSPQISRRLDFRFFSTPQVGPTFGGEGEGGWIGKPGRFSVLRTLFGDRRSKKPERDWEAREGSGSWFSELVRRRKKQPQISAAEREAPVGHGRRGGQVVERGMSPAEEDNKADASGYSSESSNGRWRPNSTPMRRTVTSSRNHHRRRRHDHHQTELGSVSGFAVFLSPLKRVGTTARRT
ncbi:hypothetical protein ZIOFF_015242 [Zingiber officinale]|uniref:Uncharacterized protein n=2 Tax=Zingiber officinale TaxID=94328 RepID=A0A8J5HYD6_ZINOF|nr:hypothetical protein ZIOFF_015242 [Zingiber officinale]